MKYLKLKKTSPEEERKKERKKKENERRNKSCLEREATNKQIKYYIILAMLSAILILI